VKKIIANAEKEMGDALSSFVQTLYISFAH